ncbi:MAG: DEAD/DEAH box helicase [Lachnospiraceae bacterium]|nr:DEAD/DEAH box helicase [Lachnospiraceae bacterium]
MIDYNEQIKNIEQGIQTAFINSAVNSNLAYKPQLLTNNYLKGQKVLSSIEEGLLNCDEFVISVAFITQSGIIPLLQIFKELERKGVKGRILTTDYQTFTDPKALETLHSLNNIEIRMFTSEDNQGFHTKGYIFKQGSLFRIIIGSSNMTQSALTINQEWNTRVVSTHQGEYAQQICKEFEDLWNHQNTKVYDDFFSHYKTQYEIVKRQREILRNEQVVSFEAYRLQPNVMQIGFIENLKKLREKGAKKALLISATGTGKTYASAFAVRDVLLTSALNKRVLFLVHREQIAKQALETFRRVFGSSVKVGLLSGNSKDYDSQFLFSTMQMMAKEETLHKYNPEEFACIILDEAHRTGAVSYQTIMEYFHPDFWLGMTASPERMDDFDVFDLFDHNIAYEIRLQQAMEEDLLCPFHYFGITDFEIDGEVSNDETSIKNFRYLVSEDRVNYIIDQIKYYGYSGDRVKGLVFCSRKQEADELAELFFQKGFRTKSLGGTDPQHVREDAMDRLISDERSDYLDYIFTVDIFNEGVDLPEVNQVIMLRPTESPIVFVQQLGRGLRKAKGKEIVVVLDFIGNYLNNFMIPIALSGDHSYNKDNVRRYLMEGSRIIPGASTIHFDEISKKRIFAAIDTANFSAIQLIKENYKNLKYKLGRIPSLLDFDRYGEMDVLRIFDNNTLGSYYKFLVKYEPDYKVRLNKQEEKVIEFISKKIANGKRIHEVELLSRLIAYQKEWNLIGKWKDDLKKKYGVDITKPSSDNAISVLTNEFPSGSGRETYKECVFLEKDCDDYHISKPFAEMVKNASFLEMVEELIAFARFRYQRDYSVHYRDTDLVLYQKYTYEEVCRLLGWEHSEVPLNIGGYKYDRKTKTFPVFINYDKADDIQDTVKYGDHFESQDHLIAISKSKRTVESEDVQNFLHAKERGISVELFVRKNKDDKISKEFYYLGRMSATGYYKEFIMPNTDVSAVEIGWKLDTPVREDLYEYILS